MVDTAALGIFSRGKPRLDVFLTAQARYRTLDVPDQAGLVVLRLDDAGRESDAVRDALNAGFKTKGTNAVAFTWKDMGGPFIGGMLVTNFIATIMNFVMGIIVAAGVLNTVLMATFERTREMGTMRAMGARKLDVLSVFLSEGFLIGVFGAALGAFLDAGAIVFFSHYGIPAFSEAQKYTYGCDRLYPMLKVLDVVRPPLINYKLFPLTGPDRLVLDLQASTLSSGFRLQDVAKGAFAKCAPASRAIATCESCLI